MGTHFKSCDFTPYQVFIDGITYWRTVDFNKKFRSNYVILFDLKREKITKCFFWRD